MRLSHNILREKNYTKKLPYTTSVWTRTRIEAFLLKLKFVSYRWSDSNRHVISDSRFWVCGVYHFHHIGKYTLRLFIVSRNFFYFLDNIVICIHYCMPIIMNLLFRFCSNHQSSITLWGISLTSINYPIGFNVRRFHLQLPFSDQRWCCSLRYSLP